jgi:hypothetical protein
MVTANKDDYGDETTRMPIQDEIVLTFTIQYVIPIYKQHVKSVP